MSDRRGNRDYWRSGYSRKALKVSVEVAEEVGGSLGAECGVMEELADRKICLFSQQILSRCEYVRST